jgi:outer membrane immunogenic protein
MKKFLLTTTALAGMTAGAFAADLPRRAAPPVFAPVPPAFTWTGFYVGVNAGYGFGNNENRDNLVFIPAGSIAGSAGTQGTLTFSDSGGNKSGDGFVGGGQIGYNYQFTPGAGFVIGVEADIQYADFGGRRRNDFGFASGAGYTFVGTPGLAFAPPPATVFTQDVRSLDWFGTARGRLGYAFNTVLVYGTGGFAFSDKRTGYAAGGGVEFALPTTSFLNFFGSSAVTFKIEGLYVNLDSDKRNTESVYDRATNRLFLGNNVRQDNDFIVARAGLNYKF